MLLEKFNPTIPLAEDGFAFDSAGSWTLQKNQIIYNYLQVFTQTMIRKFDYLVFLDLNSGSGLKKTDDGQLTYGSPILALDNPAKFSKYIFCESDPSKAEALQIRVRKYYRGQNVIMFNDNPNTLIEKLSYYLPESSRKNKVSTLCLVDLFSLDIEFETVQALADFGVNFLVVLSLPWTSENTFRKTMEEERELINAFLGKAWSEIVLDHDVSNGEMFFRTLVRSYHQQIRELGFHAKGSFYKMDTGNLSIPVFFAGYYSQKSGHGSIYREVQKKVAPQVNLFE